MGRGPLASGSSFHPGRRLLAAAAVLTLVFGVGFALLLWTNYRDDTARTRETTAALAKATALTTDTFLRDRIQILTAIARSDEVRSQDRARRDAYFARLDPVRLTFTGGLGWIDRTGHTIPPGQPTIPPVDLSDRDYVRAVLHTGKPYVSRAVVGRIKGAPVVVVAVPTTGVDGSVTGVLVGLVRLDVLSGLQALQPPGAALTIVDRAGQVIFDDGPIKTLTTAANHALLSLVRGDPDGGVLDRVANLDGRDDRVIGYAHVPTGRWVVFSDRSVDTVYAAAARKLRTGLIVLVLAAGLALAGAAMIGLRLDRLARAGEDARAQAERRRRDAERLHRLASSIAAAIDVAEVMEVTITQATAELGAERGAIYLVEDEHGESSLVPWPGFEETLDRNGRVPLEAQITGKDAVATGAGVYLESPREISAQYPELTPLVTEDGPAWVTMPLVGGGHALGVLFLSFAGSRTFDDGERRFLRTLAEQTAVGLGRALLHHTTESAERGARLLAEAAAAMEEEETFAGRAERLVDVLVPTFADYASIEAAGTNDPVALATADPALVPVLRELRRGVSGNGAHPRSLSHPAEGNTPYVVEDAAAVLGELGLDQHVAGLLHQLAPRSYASLSLRGRGGRLGALLVGTTQASGRSLTRHDLPLLTRLAERAGLALENAMLYERERAVAGTLQESLLPAELPEIPGVELASAYVAGSEGVEVGGDFYDAFATAGGPVLVIGDVCGRGAEAAAMTALCRYTLRTAALEGGDTGPARLLEVLNRAILAQFPENTQFCTVSLARLARRDDGTVHVTIASAAHPPALCLRADNSVQWIDPLGGLMGVFAGSTFPETELELEAGDGLLLYTDGVVEARSGSELYGEDRLAGLVRSLVDTGAEEIVKRVLSSIDLYTDGRLADDVALLCLRNLGVPAGGSDDAVSPLKLALPADSSSLAPLRTSLRAWLDEAGVEEDASRDIVLACNEAVANAALHAYAPDQGEIEINVELSNGDVVVSVTDTGRWRAADADRRPPVERGRGFALMRAAMDAVDVDRDETGTTVVLRRSLVQVTA